MLNRATVTTSSPGAKALVRVVLAICLAAAGLARSADAEVRVSGTANAVNVATQSATLDEIFRALQSNFKFQYQGSNALPDAISGTYAGSLRSVVARLLAGHDFIMHGTSDDLSVFILVGGKAVAVANGPAPNRVAKAAAAPPPAKPDPRHECTAVIGGQTVAVEC